MKENRRPIEYHVVDNFDHIIDEEGNQTINLRKLYWGSNDSHIKLDLRKWYIDENGTEIVGKGLSFLTEEGPHTLAELMLSLGYGDTKTILNNVKCRKDFRHALNEVLGEGDEYYDKSVPEDDGSATFYDPKEYLFGGK